MQYEGSGGFGRVLLRNDNGLAVAPWPCLTAPGIQFRERSLFLFSLCNGCYIILFLGFFFDILFQNLEVKMKGKKYMFLKNDQNNR